MTFYLTASDILGINRNFEGPDQLRDFGLLDGAVMRPQASAFGEDAFPTVHEKAAALLHGLARNHPFVNGNKRTAWAATSMFYMVNSYNLHVDQIDDGQRKGLCPIQDFRHGALAFRVGGTAERRFGDPP